MSRLSGYLARHFMPNTRRLARLGMRIGKNVYIDKAAIIDESHCWLIALGDDVTIAPRAHLLAHDASTNLFLGTTRVANVTVGDRVFIGAGGVILPGVTIGDDCVIAAGAVVTGPVETGSVVAGNPARAIARTEDFLEKHRRQMADSPFFDIAEWTVNAGIPTG